MSNLTSPPRAAVLRAVLDEVLRTDADFEAFCVDHFPAVQRRFASAAERAQRTSLLFQLVDHSVIWECLVSAYPIDAERARAEQDSRRASPTLSLPRTRTPARWLLLAALLLLILIASWRWRSRQVPALPSLAPRGFEVVLPTDRRIVEGEELSVRPEVFGQKVARLVAEVGDQGIEFVLATEADSTGKGWRHKLALIDKRKGRPVAFLIYTDRELHAWRSDPARTDPTLLAVILALETTTFHPAPSRWNPVAPTVASPPGRSALPRPSSPTRRAIPSALAERHPATTPEPSPASSARPYETAAALTSPPPAATPPVAAPAPTSPGLVRPLLNILPPAEVLKDLIDAPPLMLPDVVRAKFLCRSVDASYLVCVNREGGVDAVRVLQGITGADTALVETLSRWCFRPRTTRACFVKTVSFLIGDKECPS